MTIFAGIISRHDGVGIEKSYCESIKNSISRYPNEKLWELHDSRFFFTKVDIGAYGAGGVVVEQNGSVSLLAGEPLLDFDSQQPVCPDRMHDLKIMHKKWEDGKWGVTRAARGVFCAMHYEPEKRQLSLVADKLGLRPLYYWFSNNYVVFSTALRVLEEIPLVEKILDVRGVAEISSFGFPLGKRTPYSNIFNLKAAEIFQVDSKDCKTKQYWSWNQLPSIQVSEEDLLKEAYLRFDDAITIRQGNDKSAISFLSGGLDSRCIVGVLISKNINIHTFTIYHDERSQDQVFAAGFAEKANSLHSEVNIPSTMWVADYAKQIRDAWSTSRYRTTYPVDRPQLLWSGDGGSVSVGAVYLNKQIIDMMRSGQVDAAVDSFLKEQDLALPKRLFNGKIANTVVAIPKQGIIEELKEISDVDPGRQFHLFLMLNDQRRHLSKHFENIDLHRMEFHLPFFDGKFLELIFAAPIDLFLRHKFYHEWLESFPAVVTATPWQTYPGHVKCPVTVSAGNDFGYQWDKSKFLQEEKKKKHALVRQSINMITSRSFPATIMNRFILGAAIGATFTEIRRSYHIMDTAKVFFDYFSRCDGKYSL